MKGDREATRFSGECGDRAPRAACKSEDIGGARMEMSRLKSSALQQVGCVGGSRYSDYRYRNPETQTSEMQRSAIQNNGASGPDTKTNAMQRPDPRPAGHGIQPSGRLGVGRQPSARMNGTQRAETRVNETHTAVRRTEYRASKTTGARPPALGPAHRPTCDVSIGNSLGPTSWVRAVQNPGDHRTQSPCSLIKGKQVTQLRRYSGEDTDSSIPLD
jgi:hypothetical protein